MVMKESSHKQAKTLYYKCWSQNEIFYAVEINTQPTLCQLAVLKTRYPGARLYFRLRYTAALPPSNGNRAATPYVNFLL